MKKVTLEVCADYIDWQEILEKLKDIISESTKEISSLQISYEETTND